VEWNQVSMVSDQQVGPCPTCTRPMSSYTTVLGGHLLRTLWLQWQWIPEVFV